MKVAAKNKDCQLVVRVKLSSNEILDEKELDRFSRLFLRGFLRPKHIKNDIVEYTGPMAVSFFERFRKPISKRDFLLILEQIVVAVQKLQNNKLPIHNLIMNLQCAYINETTKEVQFVYVPTKTGFQNSNLIDFVDFIARSAKLAPGDDPTLVSRFIQFFKGMAPFDVCNIESFVALEDNSVINTIRKQASGQSGFMTNKQQHYYEHYDKVNATNTNGNSGATNVSFGTIQNGPAEKNNTALHGAEYTNRVNDTTNSQNNTNMVDSHSFNNTSAGGNNYDDDATGLLGFNDNTIGAMNDYNNVNNVAESHSFNNISADRNNYDDDATGLLGFNDNSIGAMNDYNNVNNVTESHSFNNTSADRNNYDDDATGLLGFNDNSIGAMNDYNNVTESHSFNNTSAGGNNYDDDATGLLGFNDNSMDAMNDYNNANNVAESHSFNNISADRNNYDDDATGLLGFNDNSMDAMNDYNNVNNVTESHSFNNTSADRNNYDNDATGLLGFNDNSNIANNYNNTNNTTDTRGFNNTIGVTNNYNNTNNIVDNRGFNNSPINTAYDADGSEETTLLSNDGEETTLLVNNAHQVRFPTLLRVNTNETISINKPVFRLGKEKSYVDYFVTNNTAVSRSHADIITRGNKYFVKDLNSKNRTFINHVPLPVLMEFEINDGDHLKLGNEEFIFHI